MTSAPASANACASASTGSTMRWTSIGTFLPSALKKIEQVRRRIEASGRDIRLEVDGGIKVDNIRAAADAGCDTFVAGSAIFGAADYRAVIAAMRAKLGG